MNILGWYHAIRLVVFETCQPQNDLCGEIRRYLAEKVDVGPYLPRERSSSTTQEPHCPLGPKTPTRSTILGDIIGLYLMLSCDTTSELRKYLSTRNCRAGGFVCFWLAQEVPAVIFYVSVRGD